MPFKLVEDLPERAVGIQPSHVRNRLFPKLTLTSYIARMSWSRICVLEGLSLETVQTVTRDLCEGWDGTNVARLSTPSSVSLSYIVLVKVWSSGML